MTPGLRKFVLAAHLTFSVGWIGTVVSYLALGVSAVTSQDAQSIRSAWIAMELTGWFVIVPLAFAALLSGLVMALSTPWGLFRHYWVLTTFGLTLFATTILVLHMPSVSALADLAREAQGAELGRLGGDFLHAGGGLLVLLLITVLNVYKPRGMTRYGWRKQQEQGAAGVGFEREATARWVKAFGIIALVAILLVVIVLIGGPGGHGPGRHLSGFDGGHGIRTRGRGGRRCIIVSSSHEFLRTFVERDLPALGVNVAIDLCAASGRRSRISTGSSGTPRSSAAPSASPIPPCAGARSRSASSRSGRRADRITPSEGLPPLKPRSGKSAAPRPSAYPAASVCPPYII